MRTSMPLILLLTLAIMFFAAPAFAYIDPGTGSYLVQGLIAAVIGISVTGKVFWARIKSFITGKPLEENQDDDDDDE